MNVQSSGVVRIGADYSVFVHKDDWSRMKDAHTQTEVWRILHSKLARIFASLYPGRLHCLSTDQVSDIVRDTTLPWSVRRTSAVLADTLPPNEIAEFVKGMSRSQFKTEVEYYVLAEYYAFHGPISVLGKCDARLLVHAEKNFIRDWAIPKANLTPHELWNYYIHDDSVRVRWYAALRCICALRCDAQKLLCIVLDGIGEPYVPYYEADLDLRTLALHILATHHGDTTVCAALDRLAPTSYHQRKKIRGKLAAEALHCLHEAGTIISYGKSHPALAVDVLKALADHLPNQRAERFILRCMSEPSTRRTATRIATEHGLT